jgi:hypothetical protein
MVINNIGEEALASGNIGEAKGKFKQAVDTWRALGESTRDAVTQNNLAKAASQEGDLVSAKQLNEQALSAFREKGY